MARLCFYRVLLKAAFLLSSIELFFRCSIIYLYQSSVLSKIEDKLFMFPNSLMILNWVTELCASDLESGRLIGGRWKRRRWHGQSWNEETRPESQMLLWCRLSTRLPAALTTSSPAVLSMTIWLSSKLLLVKRPMTDLTTATFPALSGLRQGGPEWFLFAGSLGVMTRGSALGGTWWQAQG